MSRITVYVCRDQAHMELVENVRTAIRGVRGRHTVTVIQIPISHASEFPAYLSRLEEVYGGVSTVEFRLQGVRTLPAVVVDGTAVVQGRIPSPGELREMLGYAGLR